MKSKSIIVKIISLSLLAFIFIVLNYFLISKNNLKQNSKDNLINISSLSEEFMDEYFEEVSEVKEEDKENMLIIISKEGLKDTFGATKVIEAPNNQYILQYENINEKSAALSKFKEDKSIVSVEENGYYTVDDTTYNSWGVESMSLDYAKDIADDKELEEVTVAIIDTGCDIDLANKYYSGKISETYNVLNKSTKVMTDENGHGTHVLGTIAESTPSNVKVLPIKVTETGNMYYTDIVAAINYIVDNKKADVINMSLGGYGRSASLEQAIEGAKQNNIISVTAAGNDNTSNNHYPSSYSNTISIASVDSNLNKSSFSNYGSTIDFTAPGTNIKSIMNKNTTISKGNNNNAGDDYEIISGTSMAAPHASSAVAILKSYNKDLTFDNTIELLRTLTVDLGDNGWDKYYGYGLISFENAQFCDGNNCDEYGVFKESDKLISTKIEIPFVSLTAYNYGTKYNLFNTDMKIHYSDESYEIKKLWELDDLGLEINNYDPYKLEEQEIEIRYDGHTTLVTFTHPENYESGWDYVKLDENNIEITAYKDNRYDIGVLYIPEKIDGYKVASLAGNTSLKSKVFGSTIDFLSFEKIVLPKTLTNLGRASLYGGKYEKVISLADSIAIGEYVFYEVPTLKTFDGVISQLSNSSFAKAALLEKIELSDNITEIPSSAFSECTNLQEINISSQIVSIGDYAFLNNYKLTNVMFSESLKTIGDYAFSYTNLDNVEFPESLEEIGDFSFAGSNIKSLFIPNNLTYIGENAFAGCASLESIVVDEENPNYDSRNYSNALIETNTNTLLKGTNRIPNTVSKIGSYAFGYDLRLYEIEIPSGIYEIGDYAFYGCSYLEAITIPRSVQCIGNNALKTYSPLTLFTYTDAYAKSYAVNNKIDYITMNPSKILVNTTKNKYNAFDKVNKNEDISSIKLYYDVGETINSTYVETAQKLYEDIDDNYIIKYKNNTDSFRYGDIYYTISGVNYYGEQYEKQVNVAVEKIDPKYTIPNNIQANIGQKLSEIILPEGFEWMDSTIVLDELGTFNFKAKYIPLDTQNYRTIEDIEISVLVSNPKEVVIPNVLVNDKVYDETNTISFDSISISNLSKTEYSILSIVTDGIDVGNYELTIKLKLSDEKFNSYSFDNGKQEKEFIVNYKIVPKKLNKPSLKNIEYVYNGLEQLVELNNYQDDKMNIIGNKRTNAGQQDVIVSLKSSNYIWDDNSREDVILRFKINKADANIEYSSSGKNVAYDGKLYGINLEINSAENVIVKYMDNDGNYILDEMPMYKNVGSYTIKFRIYINDNYTDIFDEEILIIKNNEILDTASDYESIYDGKEHTIDLSIGLQDYEIKYSVNNYDYNLDELPKFKDVGEYTINYKIIAQGYEELTGSNKVKIYGIKSFNNEIKIKDNILILTDNSFNCLKSNINVYSLTKSFNHLDVNKKIVNSDFIKTGEYLNIKINDLKNFVYQLAYIGDVDGNGKIDYLDYVDVYNHIQKIKNPTSVKKELKGVHLISADMSGDNKVNYMDYVYIYDKINELKGGK